MHCVRPLTSPKCPAAHAAHSAMLWAAPFPSYVPSGHCLHACCPSASWYSPASQSAHVDVAVELEYLPAMHCEHDCVPVLGCAQPLLHAMHVASVLALALCNAYPGTHDVTVTAAHALVSSAAENVDPTTHAAHE